MSLLWQYYCGDLLAASIIIQWIRLVMQNMWKNTNSNTREMRNNSVGKKSWKNMLNRRYSGCVVNRDPIKRYTTYLLKIWRPCAQSISSNYPHLIMLQMCWRGLLMKCCDVLWCYVLYIWAIRAICVFCQGISATNWLISCSTPIGWSIRINVMLVHMGEFRLKLQ